MKRRDFLGGAATGAVIAGGAVYLAATNKPAPMEPGMPEAPGNAPAVNTGVHEWKMVTTWPKNFPGAGTAAQGLADAITAMSDGRLTIKLFAAGEMVPAFESFDAVREGIADCSHDAAYYWVAKNKSIPFFCAVPGGLTVREHNAWILHGGGQQLWDELYAEFGVRAFLSGNTGTQMGGWFQREINSLDDFNGLKIRIPGLAAEVLNRVGATTVNMPAGEIMPALQSGVIDAAEWVGPWVDLTMGFYKVAKNYYGPGFHEGSTANELLINEASWQALSSDLQAIVRVACHEANMTVPAEYFARNTETLPVLTGEHDVIVRNYPDDVIEATYKISEEVNAETANEGDLNRRIYESWSDFRRRAIEYQPLSDFGFIRNRAKASAT
ncbi:MAG: TRAP transporter substrate-binding protein [Alphaproteobacteria bacterium]|nr:TRAP transporter substrate-binding protein [Alphaproteobacteria bacterium]